MIWFRCGAPPKGLEEKGLGYSLNLISELIPGGFNWVVTGGRWGVAGGSGSLGVWLWGTNFVSGEWSLSLCFLITMWAASLCHTFPPWCSASFWALRNGASLLWTKTSATVSLQINISSSTIVQVRSFSHSSKKLTKTITVVKGTQA